MHQKSQLSSQALMVDYRNDRLWRNSDFAAKGKAGTHFLGVLASGVEEEARADGLADAVEIGAR